MNIAKKAPIIAALAGDFHKTCNVLFEVDKVEVKAESKYGEVKLFPTDKSLGEINIFIFPDNILVQAPLGPAHNFGKYFTDELNAMKEEIGIPCELQGI
jgi:hypothetical protein